MHQVKLFTWLTELNEWLREISNDPYIEVKEITPTSNGNDLVYVVHFYDGGSQNE